MSKPTQKRTRPDLEDSKFSIVFQAHNLQIVIDPKRSSVSFAHVFFLSKIFETLKVRSILLCLDFGNFFWRIKLYEEMDIWNCKKFQKLGKFFYSGGGAATLGWSATAHEHQGSLEKMKIHLHRSSFFSRFVERRESFSL